MDALEKYIKENRAQLDTEEWSEYNQMAINKRFKEIRRKRNIRLVLSASGIAALLVIAFFLFPGNLKHQESPQKQGLLLAFDTELAKQEAGYIQLVNQSKESIRQQRFPAEYEYMFSNFIKQLEIIDRQYVILSEQVERVGYTPELVQQIIYNYQLKLSVLEMLQNEINKINNLSKSTNYENEKQKISI